MENKKVNYGVIIFVIVLIVLFIPIITDYVKKQNIEVLSNKLLKEKIDSDESFIVYIGDLDKSISKKLINARDITKTDYAIDYNVYNIKADSVTDLVEKDVVLAIYIEGDLQKTYTEFDNKALKEDVEVYYLGKITDDNKSYKVAENFNAYKKIVNSDAVTMAVFGRNSCSWCNKFKPIYNAVAEKYEVDIYYFDSDNYNSSDYNKIVNMDLTVPSKCSSDGKEFKLSDGFGTPLSIFTKNGEVVDCISGYINRSSLIEKLKSNNIIGE